MAAKRVYKRMSERASRGPERLAADRKVTAITSPAGGVIAITEGHTSARSARVLEQGSARAV